MKANRLKRLLLFLCLCAVFQLPAQQSEADRKLLMELRAKAEKGEAQSQHELGQVYYFGNFGVAKDYAEAVKWIRKAADQGYAPAQLRLGHCFSIGEDVTKDSAEAVKWYRKAAEQGIARAQASLGLCYYFGEGVTKDSAEAVRWYRKAADQGMPLAQRQLGTCYFRGEGVPQDYAEAVKWRRKAAEQDDDEAQAALGVCYLLGHGVLQDYAEAVKWLRKAAEKGYAPAQCQLGLLYAQGQGVPQNDVEAYTWLSLAAAQGEEKGQAGRDLVVGRMSREEVVEGQRRATAFVPKKNTSSEAGVSGTGIMPSIFANQPKASGSGFFITPDGFLISNAHVVEGAAQVRLVTSAGLISAKVVKVDAANDLALLKAEGRFAALPVAASRRVKLGGTVATVGFPNIGLQGFAPKLAKGEIASLSGAGDDARYFQISVPVQPGNSGGALVDERGNVVGVVSAKLSARAALAASGALPENVNYAVKSSYLLSFLESVPEVAAKLKEPRTAERKFEEVVKDAEQAAVLVLVY